MFAVAFLPLRRAAVARVLAAFAAVVEDADAVAHEVLFAGHGVEVDKFEAPIHGLLLYLVIRGRGEAAKCHRKAHTHARARPESAEQAT